MTIVLFHNYYYYCTCIHIWYGQGSWIGTPKPFMSAGSAASAACRLKSASRVSWSAAGRPSGALLLLLLWAEAGYVRRSEHQERGRGNPMLILFKAVPERTASNATKHLVAHDRFVHKEQVDALRVEDQRAVPEELHGRGARGKK